MVLYPKNLHKIIDSTKKVCYHYSRLRSRWIIKFQLKVDNSVLFLRKAGYLAKETKK